MSSENWINYNLSRPMAKILGELSAEHGYELSTYSRGWILKLRQPTSARERFVFGYRFELNSSTASALMNDKSAAFEVLSAAEIPSVRHDLVSHPSKQQYADHLDYRRDISTLARKFSYPLVCKANNGTSGNLVFRCLDDNELQNAINQVFTSGDDAALSPLMNITSEYRVVMLDGECLLSYEKQVPTVTGDGFKSFYELIELEDEQTVPHRLVVSNQHALAADASYVLKKGECVPITWKSNLRYCAKPVDIIDDELLKKLVQLSCQCLDAVNGRCASVDIVRVNNELKVLELNSGIMIQHFVKLREDGYQRAKAVYQRLVEAMFEKEKGW